MPFDKTLPCEHVEFGGEPFERTVRLRGILRQVTLCYCLDFESAAVISLSGIRATLVLELNELPSLRYQDSVEQRAFDLEKLGGLIQREELTLRRCDKVICANLKARRLALSRGVSSTAIVDVAHYLPKPSSALSTQALNHFVYEHTRECDARIIYEALRRLKFPWRLSVVSNEQSVLPAWSSDQRVSQIRDDGQWRSTLKTARLVIAGGAASKVVSSGLGLPRLAAWAPHYGISVLTTENAAWRGCVGGWGLILEDRPDLMAQAITELSLNDAFRLAQHDGIRNTWNTSNPDQDLAQWSSFWAQTI